MLRVVVALLVVHATAFAAPKLSAAIEPLAKSLVASGAAPGVVIALIAPDAPPQVLAWGETARGNGKRPGGDTVFEIGSVSKVFTSLLLAELVVDKTVTLDTPVATLLPPKTKLPAGKRAITLLDLATHTSGLPRMPDNFHPADPANPYAEYTTEQLFAFLATATIAHEPGANYEYSNLGAGLLGQALAGRAKQDWASLVVTQIARPLGMTSTMVALSANASARFAQGYDTEGDATKPWDLPALAGAGALRSTANDLVRFVQAELAATKQATTPLAKAMALSQQPERDLTSGPPGKVGLGWHIKPDGVVWHNGGTGGFRSFVAFDPVRGTGVVVLANGATDAIDQLGLAALAALAGGTVPATLVLPAADTPIDEKTLAAYAGTYRFSPAITVTVTTEGGKLYAQLTGQPRLRLHATSPTEFALRVVKASVTFEIDPKGKPTAIVLHQNGVDQRASR